MDKRPFKKLLAIAKSKGVFEKHAELAAHYESMHTDIHNLANAMKENDITAALFDHVFMKCIFGDDFERVMKEAVMINKWQDQLDFVAQEAEKYDEK